jgi:hypothetical protein
MDCSKLLLLCSYKTTYLVTQDAYGVLKDTIVTHGGGKYFVPLVPKSAGLAFSGHTSERRMPAGVVQG